MTLPTKQEKRKYGLDSFHVHWKVNKWFIKECEYENIYLILEIS